MASRKKPSMENMQGVDREITWIKEVLREHEVKMKELEQMIQRPRSLSSSPSFNSVNSLNSISFTNSPRTLKRKKKKQHEIFSITSQNSPNTRARKIKNKWNTYTSKKSKRKNKINNKFNRFHSGLNVDSFTSLPFNINKPQENNSPYIPNSPREFMPSSPLYIVPNSPSKSNSKKGSHSNEFKKPTYLNDMFNKKEYLRQPDINWLTSAWKK
jgi:hypothetical protein